jgi:hypothetical protein
MEKNKKRNQSMLRASDPNSKSVFIGVPYEDSWLQFSHTKCDNTATGGYRKAGLKRQSHEIFDLWFFFVKHLPLGHCFTPLSVFANNFEFTQIFELKVDSAVSMTPLSQKNVLRQPPFFKLLPQRCQ